MKCRSCQEDIPSKFIKALQRNECPMCDGQIIDPRLQVVFGNLKLAMDNGKEFQEEIADWLFSNYGFRKYDPNDTSNNHRSQSVNEIQKNKISVNRIGDDDDNTEDDQYDDRTDFAIRAGVRVKKNNKSLINIIQSGDIDTLEAAAEANEQNEYEDHIQHEKNPLNRNDRKEVFDLFPVDTKLEKALELEKIKKYRNQLGGLEGKVKRGDE